jgi:hypothetical protein
MVTKVNKNAFFQIDVKMKGGFKFKIPTQGHGLKSLLDFQKTLLYVEKYSFKEITEKDYIKLMGGKSKD